ncbi:MAG: NADP-dependent malic enzyme [Erysipelotrichaceae bacterium]|nr:NADP-dependent malic enzyme [Erysipelotrichaceae bacterium]
MEEMSKALRKHYEWKGKIAIKSLVAIDNQQDLAVAYTPGVADACLAIRDDVAKSFELTRRWNTVAVITDGTAVLGLGDIGPEAGMPVMEGKCLLFKEFADIDAFPLCIKSKNTEDIIRTVQLLSGSFGGINLEDISAPRCFEIERQLREICPIPVMHDDQHGTAIVVCAALKNALKLVKKSIQKVRIVINGPGAAGLAIGKLLISYGAENIIFVDKKGILDTNDPYINSEQQSMAVITNPDRRQGTLQDALVDCDVFIGVSAGKVLNAEMVHSMNRQPIIFAMANPIPEIFPNDALAAGAYIVGTGRSDYPNQINNVLAFPGIFRGALDCRAKTINEAMKMAAVDALADLIDEQELSVTNIIPSLFDQRVVKAVSTAVIKAAIETKVSQL